MWALYSVALSTCRRRTWKRHFRREFTFLQTSFPLFHNSFTLSIVSELSGNEFCSLRTTIEERRKHCRRLFLSLHILICLARVGNMAPLSLPDPVNKNCHFSVWFLKSNWNSSMPTIRSATTVTGSTWWPIGLQENNNTFQEIWLWANQQLVKNNREVTWSTKFKYWWQTFSRKQNVSPDNVFPFGT